MNELTKSMNNSTSLDETAYLIQQHEHLAASVLKTLSLDKKLWRDSTIVSKSLWRMGR